MHPSTSRSIMINWAAQIFSQAQEACAAVFPGTHVFLAYAYGSRVEGNPHPESDLDIGYYLDAEISQPLPMAEEMVLADRLSRLADVEIDLRNLGEAPLEWRARVLERGTLLYCSDEPARVSLEVRLLTRWFDERPRLERIHAERLAQFAATGLSAAPCP
jgi:predicted nucleotidyltransferase